MSREHLKVRNPELKQEIADLWDEIDSVAADAEAYADGVLIDAEHYTDAAVSGLSAKATPGTPVNAVAAKATLTFINPVADGETITVGADIYEFASDVAQSVAAGNIAVDVIAVTTASTGTLTMAAQPGANETVVIGTAGSEVTYTFVGSNPQVGEVDLGADAAEAQANLVAAINGTDGINEPHPEVSASAFIADVCTITALVGGVVGDSITTTDTLVGAGDGFAAAALAGGADATADNAITAVVAASALGTEPVTITDGAGSTLVVTADVAGVAAESIITETTCANGTFDVAHLDGGVDGTVGEEGDIWFAPGRIYVCTADNTISDANWQSAVIA